MPRIVIVLAATVLILHGLIHLMGAVVYLKLANIAGLAYKTTVLGGHVDLGESGIRAFGVFWFVAAVGFTIAAVGFLGGWDYWRIALAGITLVSLALTGLDWDTAFVGVMVNVAILAVLALSLRVA